jgi:hypothetical protein
MWAAAVSTPFGRITKDAVSEEAAKVELVKLFARRDAGRDLRTDSRLASYLERWLADTRPTVRLTTFDHYRLVCRHMIAGLGRRRLGAKVSSGESDD